MRWLTPQGSLNYYYNYYSNPLLCQYYVQSLKSQLPPFRSTAYHSGRIKLNKYNSPALSRLIGIEMGVVLWAYKYMFDVFDVYAWTHTQCSCSLTGGMDSRRRFRCAVLQLSRFSDCNVVSRVYIEETSLKSASVDRLLAYMAGRMMNVHEYDANKRWLLCVHSADLLWGDENNETDFTVTCQPL